MSRCHHERKISKKEGESSEGRRTKVCIRKEGTKGRCGQDLGPPMLLAIVAPPGSGTYAEYSHNRGHDGLQTGGTCLHGRVGEAPVVQHLPRVLGIGVFWDV